MALSVFAPIVLAMLAGPIGFAAATVSQRDPSQVYVLIGADRELDAAISQHSVREVGVYRAPFARLVQVPPEIHAWLVDGGYWMLPAGTLAELCRVDVST